MQARIRDVVVVAVLLIAALAAVLAWHPLGRWMALLIALAGLLAAAGIYRARPSAFPLFGPGMTELPDEPQAAADEAASTPRPS